MKTRRTWCRTCFLAVVRSRERLHDVRDLTAYLFAACAGQRAARLAGTDADALAGALDEAGRG